MWYEKAGDHHFIKSLYQEVPELNNVEVSAIVLSFHNRLIKIGFMIRRFPDFPPKKWHKDRDSISITLEFWNVEALEMNGFNNRVLADIHILEVRENIFQVEIKSPTFNAKFESGYYRIGELTPARYFVE
jgi:hypothetical protein